MKERFTIARNTMTISMPDGLSVREGLMRRYGPFVSARDERPVLEIDLSPGVMCVKGGEVIYEPEFDGIGFVVPRVMRLADGGTVTEFAHVGEDEPRVWMTMPPAMDRAEIVFMPKSDEADVNFLTHAIMIAYMLATCGNGTLMAHASTVTLGGKAYLFQGKSGTGKSTHSRLWMENIAGTELLNDDHPVVRFGADGRARAYGSPWSGKTHCYRNAEAEIGAFVRIVRGHRNGLRRLGPLEAYASLTASIFYLPYLTDEQREMRHRTIERLACEVMCAEMQCRPDAEAAITCMKGLTNETI